jgi:membrane complex biogenesis BtpA family protein
VSGETLVQGIANIWPDKKPLIGMVHLLPLPGAPRWRGPIDAALDQAERDARALQEARFDGVLVENFLDVPFFADSVPAETVAAMTAAVLRVMGTVSLPVGVNVLRNDAAAAMAIAAVTGAAFIRVNVHTGSMYTDQGLIEGKAHDTLRRRSDLRVDVRVLADVHVKHASSPARSGLADAAADTWHRGLADALIVSGPATGRAASAADLRLVRNAVSGAPVLIGSGLTQESASELLAMADGAIVGSAIMNDGRPGAGIDPDRAAALIEAVRG